MKSKKIIKNKTKWHHGYMVLIDILGFSDGLLNDDNTYINKYHEAITKILERKKRKFKYIVYSDSIVLYTTNKTQSTLNNLIMETSNLYFSLLTNGFPVRGSITYGKFSEKKYDNGIIIAGRSILEAYHYEKIQKWIGIILSPQIVDDLPQSLINNVLFHYDRIPIVENNKPEFYQGYCLIPLDPEIVNINNQLFSYFQVKKHLIKELTYANQAESQRKINFTMQFLDYAVRENVGRGPIEKEDVFFIIDHILTKVDIDTIILPIKLKNYSNIIATNISVFIKVYKENIVNIETDLNDVSNYNKVEEVYAYTGKISDQINKSISYIMGYLTIKVQDIDKDIHMSIKVINSYKDNVDDVTINLSKNELERISSNRTKLLFED